MERQVELQGSLASQASPDCELQIQRKTHLKKIRWKAIERDTCHEPLASTSTYR